LKNSSIWGRLSLLLVATLLGGCQTGGSRFSVKNFGATGNGATLDTAAVNSAIDAAARAGGGTVEFPAGTYLCYSIHLQSHVSLHLGQGSTILAAGSSQAGEYDSPEFNVFDRYQDFGHTHWHNSLIWGEWIHDVTIDGPGRIYGKGLSRGSGSPPPTTQAANRYGGTPMSQAGSAASAPRGTPAPLPPDYLPSPYAYDDRADIGPNLIPGTTQPSGDQSYPNLRDSLADGIGNKAIALKWCYNVTLRDFSILQGGHFGLLLTAVDNLTIDNVKIDTNRDGMDIDCCQNVRVSNCSVNSPQDDGICLKSSYGIGVARPCENVTITNCYVTGGYVVGAMLDGTMRKLLTDYNANLGGAPRPATQSAPTNAAFVRPPPSRAPMGPNRTGRIKFGTESNGGFINITISNCTFDDCQGLAIETVDGGRIEDVTIDNITMRHIVSVPIFIRLGARSRGPFAQDGVIRRINISNITCQDNASRYACVISGIPGHPIEDLRFSNIKLDYPADRKQRDADAKPPENEKMYPEPTMFRAMPVYGFFLRHVKNLEMDNIDISTGADEIRPPFWLEDVDGAQFYHIKAPHLNGATEFHMQQVKDFGVHMSPGIPDAVKESVDQENF